MWSSKAASPETCAPSATGSLLARLQAVVQSVEQAETLSALPNVTRLQGGDSFYRIRVGDYRIGIVLEAETVAFVRCLNRREIYRYFP